MAKIKYTEALGDLGSLRFSYMPDAIYTNMEKSTDTKYVYEDEFNGTSLSLKGVNFASLDGALLKGRVESVVFRNAEGDVTATIDGLDLGAKGLHKMLTQDDAFNIYDFLEKVMSGDDQFTGTAIRDFAWAGGGDDVIKGRGGDDSINGMGGHDTMTGGAGSDHFFFLQDGKGGRDTITDFDASGGGSNQDYIAADYDDVLSITQKGDDVVIDFGFGDKLYLLDTDRNDVGKADFHIPL